ncbi:MAG TPA: CocE/NonD family hydrolase, partial [Actinomycetota bacterium]|nr:CocE/NonD family hydrolase [Actinomycetota bacterium]
MKGFSRRAGAVVVALLTAATALSGVQAAAKSPPPDRAVPPADYTKIKGLSQPKYKTVRESFMVPMKDGINMYVEVVRPDVKGRFGTILELSPYHGTSADRSGTRIFPGPEDGMAGYFAPRGYAVVFADLRGTGRSEGCLDHMGPKDQSDAYEIVEWAAKQPWSNGRVGMTGHSYVGSTPQMAAAQKPPHLVTIVPSAGLAAMYHHEFQGGVPYYAQWAGPLVAYEQLAIQRHLPPAASGYGDNFGNGMQYFGCGATQSAAVTGEAYFSGAETEWHRERDFRKGATASKIPMFIIHGVNDNAARIAASDWFIARNGRPGDKAWIGQWDHGSG